MQVQNTNSGTNDTALDLRVQQGEAPMRVNSDAGIQNLHADRVDGLDGFEIGPQAWAVIEANGTVRGTTSGSVEVRSVGTGQKEVDLGGFSTTNCAFVVTTTDGNGGLTGTAKGDEPGEVIVYTYNFQGNVVNLPFTVVMVC